MKALSPRLIFTLLAMVTANSAEAGQIDIYAAGGISYANQAVASVPAIETTSETYYAYGLLARFDFPGDGFTLTTGALRVELGSHQSTSSALYLRDTDIKIPYIQFPFVIDYWLSEMFSFGGGIYYGFANGNISEKGTYLNNPISLSTSFNEANYKQDDYGLIIHGGFRLPMGGFFLGIDLDYETGIANASSLANQVTHNTTLLALGVLGFNL